MESAKRNRWRGSMATIGASGYVELKIRMMIELVDDIKKNREWCRKKRKGKNDVRS